MIVLKSTLAKVEAERDALAAVATENEQAMLATIERLSKEKEAADRAAFRNIGALQEEVARADALRRDNKRLRAELADTWVRNKRGHWQRHPSFLSQVSDIRDHIDPLLSRPTLDSELNKDRSGKHGSEVA